MILDCTFRDGGYLNDWGWDIDLVKKTVDVLKNHVDIIELGYRSPILDKFSTMGKFRFCIETDPDIASLGDTKSATYGVMIDIADYIENGVFNPRLLTDNFILQKKSIFTYIRVATTINNLGGAAKAVHILDSFGYKVIVSIMKRSTYSSCDIVKAYNILRETPIFAIYLADSFGAMVKDIWPKGFDSNDIKLGVHCHNNLDNALINTYNHYHTHTNNLIDASIMGIGRGAGNCDLASLLTMLGKNPSDIIDLQNGLMWKNIKSKYTWGPNYLYSKCAVENIHPKYAVELNEMGYSYDFNCKILESIPDYCKSTFDKIIFRSVVKLYE